MTDALLICSSAIAAASKLTSPGDSAWALRGAFDDILDGRVEALAKQASVPEGAEEVLVLDFGAGMTGPRWLSMDDGIMGGLSSSSFGWEPGARAAIFQGEGDAGCPRGCLIFMMYARRTAPHVNC